MFKYLKYKIQICKLFEIYLNIYIIYMDKIYIKYINLNIHFISMFTCMHILNKLK